MSFQLRHVHFGVYQGSFLGLGFWHPTSEMPEQGFCEFSTEDEALQYKHFLCTEADQPLNEEDLFVEPFNREESERLIASAGEVPR